MIVKPPGAVIYSLADEALVEKRKQLPGWLNGFLAIAVLVAGLALTLGSLTGAGARQGGAHVSAALLARSLAADPTAAPTQTAAPTTRTAPPLSLTIMLICTGGALALVFGVIVLGLVLAADRKKADQGETHP